MREMRRSIHFLFCGLLLWGIGVAAMSARGQQAAAQSATPRQNAPQQTVASSQAVSSRQNVLQQKISPGVPTIHKEVNEITTPVIVRDRDGNFVLDLQEKDFQVFDNGVEQHIDHWGLDDHPLALALVIETSSHVEMMAREIRSNGIVVTETLMAEDGKAAVITAGNTVEVRQPFTGDHDAVQNAIQRLRFTDDHIHLYDAMLEGTLLLEKQPDTCHRVLVVIAEAQDYGSQFKLGEVLTIAQRENITIYTIGLSSTAADLRSDPVKDAEAEEKKEERISSATQAPIAAPGAAKGVGGGMDLLSVAIFLVQRFTNIRKSHAMGAAVAFTGGDYYHPFKDRNIQMALSHIADELHSQYILSYQLQGPRQPGIHEIEVRVARPHVVVRARLGYYLAPPGP
jgi:VWFA-related protein